MYYTCTHHGPIAYLTQLKNALVFFAIWQYLGPTTSPHPSPAATIVFPAQTLCDSTSYSEASSTKISVGIHTTGEDFNILPILFQLAELTGCYCCLLPERGGPPLTLKGDEKACWLHQLGDPDPCTLKKTQVRLETIQQLLDPWPRCEPQRWGQLGWRQW